jgi:hypothetical protein
MNRRIHILLFSLIITLIEIIDLHSVPYLKSCIFSPKMETLPSFRVSFKGMDIPTDKDGFFSIPLDDGLENEYKLLICKEFSSKFKSINTIENISANNKKLCKFYVIKKATYATLETEIESLTKKIKDCESQCKLLSKQIELRQKVNKNTTELSKNKELLSRKLTLFKNKIYLYEQKRLAMQNETDKKAVGTFWFIKKKPIKEKNFVVPENCIVVCINPKIVQKVENWIFALSENFIPFPRIVLKDKVEQRDIPRKKSLVRSSHKSLLELDPFYEVQKRKEKKFVEKPTVVATLPM